MENKGKISISLGTAICIFIIILLVIALVGVICYNINREENKTTNNENSKIEDNLVEVEKINKEEKEKYENAEAIKKISKKNTYFIIDKIEKRDNKYEITAYLLEKDRKTFTQEEYNQILQGKEIEFRNKIWKYDPTDNTLSENGDIMTMKSGTAKIALLFDEKENVYFLENIAGAKTEGLSDIVKQSIKFEVDEDLYVGNMWYTFENDNGKIKILDVEGRSTTAQTIEDLINWNSDDGHCGSSYEECSAIVIDGKVVVIQYMD